MCFGVSVVGMDAVGTGSALCSYKMKTNQIKNGSSTVGSSTSRAAAELPAVCFGTSALADKAKTVRMFAFFAWLPHN